MQEFDFKPKLENAEDFYKKIEKKRAKLKEINQIQAFNNAKTTISSNSQTFDNQFDLAEWKVPEKGNRSQSFFKQQGKTLLSDDECFKKISKKYLICDSIFHTTIVCWSVMDGYSAWTFLSNIIMAIFSIIFVAFHFKSTLIIEFYNNHKDKLLKLYKIYECSLIISIMLSSTAILHALFIIYKDLQLIRSIKILLYLATIYVQLKLLKNVKYIILVQSQLSKQSSLTSLQQSDNYQFS